MTKINKFRGFTVAALAATALIAAQPAEADVIEINNFWAGAGNATIDFTGTDWHNQSTVTGLHELGGAGGFLTYDLTTDPKKQNGFQSFCVDIFHGFNFVVDSNDTQHSADTVVSSTAAANLAQLYTNHHDQIDSTSSSAESEAAFQLAVWEIVNEHKEGYSLNAGNFEASGTGSSLAQSWLDELGGDSTSTYTANIWTVQSMITEGHGYAQDLVTFSPIQTPVPEPETYAMMLVGLGLLGLSTRRKSQY